MTGRGLSGASRNPTFFCVRELTNAKRPQFTSEAGSFDSPESQARIGGHHIVDEHHAALKLRGKQFLLFLLACPNAGPQSVNAIVGHLDRLAFIAHAKNRRDRSENLFPINGRFSGNIDEYRRLIEKAWPLEPISARQQFCSCCYRFTDL